MSLSRAFLALALAALSSVGVSVAIASSAGSQPGSEPESGALSIEWVYRPADLEDLVAESRATLIGEVTAVDPGPPLAQESGEIPTQRIEVAATDVIDGVVPASFTLYRVGDDDTYSPDDPPYEVGSSYMLFIERRLNGELSGPDPDGSYILTAPDGRLEETPEQTLEAVTDGPVGDELGGLSTPDAADAVIGASSGGSP